MHTHMGKMSTPPSPMHFSWTFSRNASGLSTLLEEEEEEEEKHGLAFHHVGLNSFIKHRVGDV